MSDFEYFEDSHEPYLQYAIRESSLYFMSDLVFRFFTSDEGEILKNVKDIYNFETGESCSWFYSDYATDPSIISMLHCLESIECYKTRILSENDGNKLDAFMEFLIERLTFIYYDMGTRANGEETFVVINTTGEPLTATENLKPLVIYDEINKIYENEIFEVNKKNLSMANAWEEMENYFWKIRRQDDFDTADNGFKEFLRWVTLLETYNHKDRDLFKQNASENHNFSFPYKEISIKTIIDIFNDFVRLRSRFQKNFDVVKNLGNGDKLKQNRLFILLPLLAYIHQNKEATWREIKRVWKWLENLIRIDNVGKAVNDVLSDVILIGYSISDPVDILALDGISSTLLTEEERFKLQLIKNCQTEIERRLLENDIWSAQDMEVDEKNQFIFAGEIKTILKWATPDCTLDLDKFDTSKFNFYLTKLKQLLTLGDNHTTNDLTRRALLAWGYKGFPLGHSYGWSSTWKLILSNNPSEFRRFIDEANSKGISEIIRWGDYSNPIVRFEGILGYSDKKNFDFWYGSGYCACKNSYAKPIPITLATIMAEMGANIERNNYYNYYDWKILINKDEELVITPINPETKRIKEIRVTSVEGGKKLHYEVTYENFNMSITQPLSSAGILLERLNPSFNAHKKHSSQLKKYYKKNHKRKLSH